MDLLGQDSQSRDDRSSIVRQLGNRLLDMSRSSELAQYLRRTYGIRTSSRPTWSRVYVAEAEEGDYDSMCFPTSLVRAIWVCSECRIAQVEHLPDWVEDSESLFFSVPVIRFAVGHEHVLVSEWLGPHLLMYRLHTLREEGGEVTLGAPVREKGGHL